MTSEKIIMTTTPTVEGKTVSEYLAVVDGQVTQNRGMSFELRFNECLADMCKTAGSLGADDRHRRQTKMTFNSPRTKTCKATS